jgi:hypothetical protein
MKTHEFAILLFDPTSERTCLFRRCKDFQELKALAKPPGGVDLVCEAAMHLQARKERDGKVIYPLVNLQKAIENDHL